MNDNLDPWSLLWLAALSIASAIISYCMILILRPLLVRYALAHPNTRSTHRIPTPQGGGIAVIAATIGVAGMAFGLVPGFGGEWFGLAGTFGATIGLAIVGATDDIRPMEAVSRLFLQAVLVFIVILALPSQGHPSSVLPLWLERAFLFVALLWFVNLVNFMDGADWMMVAEVVPVAIGLTLFGLAGALPMYATLIAFSLCGAMIGFAPFNRPVARLFLGDVGSLPIGLLLGWLLILLATNGNVVAAILLPLYYLADATITLLRRFLTGQSVMQAHRGHYYQRALDGGMTTYQIVGRIFVVNIVLAAIAACSLNAGALTDGIALIGGAAVVGILLWNFSRAAARPR